MWDDAGWITPGGDFGVMVAGRSLPVDAAGSWYGLEIGDTVKDWYAGSTTNYGVLIQTLSGDDTQFRSSEYVADPLLRPKLTIRYYTGVNTAPVVDAGTDQGIITPEDTVSLAGSAVDAEDGLTVKWTMVSGPVLPVFVDDTDPATDVTLPEEGVYVLQLTADDGNFPLESDTIVVTVSAPASESSSNSGGCLPVSGSAGMCLCLLVIILGIGRLKDD